MRLVDGSGSKERGKSIAAPFWQIPEKVDFVIERVGGAAEHSGASLLCHLFGTYELLASWGCHQEICDVGLFHSIYGTEAYQHASLQFLDRNSLRDLIGEYSELLVYVFSMMSRKSFAEAVTATHDRSRMLHSGGMQACELDYAAFCDLCHVVAANLLEQHSRLSDERQDRLIAQLQHLRPYLSNRANTVIEPSVLCRRSRNTGSNEPNKPLTNQHRCE